MTEAANACQEADALLVLGTNFYDSMVRFAINHYSGDKLILLSKHEHFRDKSADIIIHREDGTEKVVKTMSMPQDINTLILMSGRLPKTKDECVVDADKYTESDIGKKLVIADSNEEEDRDLFAVKEFTIVGVVRSPLYAIYTRGTTALGSGSLDAFMYIMDEAYDMDYDTEVYVRFEKDAYIYSDEYEELMDSMEKEWEQFTQDVADALLFWYERGIVIKDGDAPAPVVQSVSTKKEETK